MRSFHAKPAFDFLQLSLTALGLLVAVITGKAQPGGFDVGAKPPTSPAAVAQSKGSPLGPFERYILGTIEENKRKLEDPALDAQTRASLTSRVAYDETALREHRVQLRKREAFVEALEREGKAREALENARRTTALLEARQAFDLFWAKHAQALADGQTNIQLWQNVMKARDAKDRERIAKAESELAAYLTRKLELIDRKQYPQGMSLAEVLEYYKKHPLAKPVGTKPTER